MSISELTLEQEFFLIIDHNKKLCDENESLVNESLVNENQKLKAENELVLHRNKEHIKYSAIQHTDNQKFRVLIAEARPWVENFASNSIIIRGHLTYESWLKATELK